MLLLLIDVRKKVSKIAENKPSNMSIVCVCAKYPHWATNFVKSFSRINFVKMICNLQKLHTVLRLKV